MRDEILTYWEMCDREQVALQRGMYFRDPPAQSVVLMSQRRGAPYDDVLLDDGTTLLYEGHDVQRTKTVDPKKNDQPWKLPSGKPTQNGLFADAAGKASKVKSLVRAYEKLRQGVWSDRGLFDLVGFEYVERNGRKVFKFKMRLSSVDDDQSPPTGIPTEFRRVIPSWVKQEVYKRDKGRCIECGATDELHFDHDLPFSRGGTGLKPANVRILCARHNLEKGAKIR